MYSHMTGLAADHHRQQLIDEAESDRRARMYRAPKTRHARRWARPLGTRPGRALFAH